MIKIWNGASSSQGYEDQLRWRGLKWLIDGSETSTTPYPWTPLHIPLPPLALSFIQVGHCSHCTIIGETHIQEVLKMIMPFWSKWQLGMWAHLDACQSFGFFLWGWGDVKAYLIIYNLGVCKNGNRSIILMIDLRASTDHLDCNSFNWPPSLMLMMIDDGERVRVNACLWCLVCSEEWRGLCISKKIRTIWSFYLLIFGLQVGQFLADRCSACFHVLLFFAWYIQGWFKLQLVLY